MNWMHDLASFISGALFSNPARHFVSGVGVLFSGLLCPRPCGRFNGGAEPACSCRVGEGLARQDHSLGSGGEAPWGGAAGSIRGSRRTRPLFSPERQLSA